MTFWIVYAVWVGCLAATHVVYRRMVRLARSEGYWRAYNDARILNDWLARQVTTTGIVSVAEYVQLRDQLAEEFTGLDEGWDGIDRVTFYELRP